MIDLTSLLSIQQMPKEGDLSFEELGENTGLRLENSDFISIIAHFLAEQGVSPSIDDGHALSNVDEQTLENKITANTSDESKVDELQVVKLQETDSDSSQLNSDKADLSISDNVQLAWFDAESFEPPLRKNTDELQLDNEGLKPLATLVNEVMPSTQAKINKNIAEVDNEDVESLDQKSQHLDIPILANTELPALDLVLETSDQHKLINTTKLEMLLLRNSDENLGKEEFNLNAGEENSQEQANNLLVSEESIGQPKQVEQSQNSVVNSDNNLIIKNEVLQLSGFEKNTSEELTAIIDNILTNQNTVPTHTTPPMQLVSTQLNEIAPKMIDLPYHLSDPDWSNQFNQHIVWLGQQKINTAVIKLNPQELGPLEVSINMVKDDATVNIRAHTIEVRDLIEHSIPRLRDMLTEQGLNLSQVNIESNEKQRQTSQQANDHFVNRHNNEEKQAIEKPLISRVSTGLIDYFA